MVDNRLRSIPVFIPVNTGAVTDIRVLQIGKMLLVKGSGLPEQFFPVDRSACTGGKNPFLPLIGVDILSFSSGKRPAEGTVKIPGVIQLCPVMELHHPGCAGKRPGMSADRGKQFLQKIRGGLRIII